MCCVETSQMHWTAGEMLHFFCLKANKNKIIICWLSCVHNCKITTSRLQVFFLLTTFHLGLPPSSSIVTRVRWNFFGRFVCLFPYYKANNETHFSYFWTSLRSSIHSMFNLPVTISSKLQLQGDTYWCNSCWENSWISFALCI